MNIRKVWPHAVPGIARGLAALTLVATIVTPVRAQNLGDLLKGTVKRAVQGEAQRKVDQETRRATRCALGDERCGQGAQQAGGRQDTAGDERAGTNAGGSDHPLVPRYADSRIVRREAEDFTDYSLRTGKSRSSGSLVVEGRLTRITYQGPQDRSVLEVFRNYEAQLKQDGFRVVYTCAREQCGDIRKDIESGPRYMLLWGGGDHRYLAAKRTRPEGDVHVSLYATRNEGGGPARGRAMVQLDVIEARPMEQRMVVIDAQAMRDSLASDGRVTLYGIGFDSDKDTLRSASTAQIAQIAGLLAQDRQLSVRVVGHTDATGAASHNQQLSRRRADRIVDALADEHGIVRSRMEAVGVGSAAPIASNDSEEGRALNRRVEIVKR